MSRTQATNTAGELETLKNLYNRIPKDDKIFKNFSSFLDAFHSFTEEENESARRCFLDKSLYHLGQIWISINFEFFDNFWHFDEPGFNQRSRNRVSTIETLKPELRLALSENRHNNFFEAYPFVEDILFIDETLSSEELSSDALSKCHEIINNYKRAIDKYDSLLPILALNEHINLMLENNELDQEFYSKHFKGARRCLISNKSEKFIHLSLFVSFDIPHATRNSDLGFKKFNWKAFDGLYQVLNINNLYEYISDDNLDIIIQSIKNYLEKLIQFEIGEVDIDEVPEVNLDELLRINTQNKVVPAFNIIEHYLDVADQYINEHTDHITSRLATLRVITAIGEALFVIKPLIPDEKFRLLKTLNELRDHILHSSTNQSYVYLSDLINNEDNHTIDNILSHLIALKDFFKELKLWLNNDDGADEFPDIPDALYYIEEFETEYAKNRAKDDRDVKLTVADYQNLMNSLPEADEIDNKSHSIVEDFINGESYITRDQFVQACICTKDLVDHQYRTKGKLRKIYEKFKEINKINNIRAKMYTKKFDFNNIQLNLTQQKQNTLEEIKQEQKIEKLAEFLNEHEAAKLKGLETFLDSIRKIDLTGFKKTLIKFCEEGDVLQQDFEDALQVVFCDAEEKQTSWRDAYEKHHGNIQSFKRDQATQVEFAIESIEILKDLKNTEMDIQTNPRALACEMHFALCANNVRSVKKFIDQMFDYSDTSLYFIFLPHPINETKNIFDTIISARNNLCHFEQIFNKNFTIETQRESFLSRIESLTHGTLFPEAITINDNSISKAPLRKKSHLSKLKKYLKIVKESIQKDNSDTINAYQLIEDEYISESDSDSDEYQQNPLHTILDEDEIIEEFENNEDAHSEQEVSTIGDI